MVPYPDMCESRLGRGAAVDAGRFCDFLHDDKDGVDDHVEEDYSPGVLWLGD